MSIYTKKGDQGSTSLANKERLRKDNLRLEAIGTIDELNSFIGLAVAFATYNPKQMLISIQDDLLTIGSYLGMSNINVDYLAKEIKGFEVRIDQMTEDLPELKNFILPGGTDSSSFLHVCRSITRRAERKVVTIVSEHFSPTKEEALVLQYLNRLSDLLFTLARYENKGHDRIWKQHKPM